jgi:hypothetical protein
MYRKDMEGREIDFEEVYDYVIKPAVEAAGLEPWRADRRGGAGWIHRRMIRDLVAADVAIADITSLNPNVFYELGVRHALRRQVTIMVRKSGTQIPFNVRDFPVIDYDTKLKAAEEAKKKIETAIRNGLKDPDSHSLVYEVYPDLQVDLGDEANA